MTIPDPNLVQIGLTAALVSVTIIYAWRTHVISKAAKEQAKATKQQADASVEMAEEMREQRYDTVRPVIDFEHRESELTRIIAKGVTIKEEEEIIYSCGLRCVLHNIGIGPATDVYSFTLTVSSERRQWDFGSLTIKGEMTPEIPLFLEQKGDRRFLVAYYRDVYGRCFESSREVSVDMEKNAWSIGPLKIRKIAEEELPR